MSTPQRSVKNGNRGLHRAQPSSAPPYTTSFDLTPHHDAREAPPPRGNRNALASNRHATKDVSTTEHSSAASTGRPRVSSQTSTRSEDDGSRWVWVGRPGANASVQSLSSAESADTQSTTKSDADSGYASYGHTHGEHATSISSTLDQDSTPRKGLHRSNSAPTRSPTSTKRLEYNASRDDGSRQKALPRVDVLSVHSSTSRASQHHGTATRPRHQRSNSDTTEIRLPYAHAELDPSLSSRRSSDSKATRPQVSDLRRGSLESVSSDSSSATQWSTSSYQPTNASLLRLNTAVPPRKPAAQTEHAISRISKPLPDIPESPISPPHPVSAGGLNATRPLVFRHPTVPSNVTWLPQESVRGPRTSLQHLATSNSTKALAAASGDRLDQYSVATISGHSEDLFAIADIASSLEDACGVFQRGDVLSVKEVVGTFLRTLDESKIALLAGLPDYVRDVHTITVAVWALDSQKAIFADHCSTLRPGASSQQLDHTFQFARIILRKLCEDFAKLLGACSGALQKYNADPVECADIGTFHDAETHMDQTIQAVDIRLASALQDARRKQRAGEHRGSLLNALWTSFLRTKPKVAFPPQATSARYGAANVASTKRQRSFSEPAIGPLDHSGDDLVEGLNLELKSARLVFDNISRNYLSTSHDAPLPLNPKYVRFSPAHDDKKPQIVAITVEQLVRFFTHNTDCPESDTITLIDAFFLFFRHYIDALDLVGIMINIYQEPMPEELGAKEQRRWRVAQASTKLGVVRLMAFWLEQYFVTLTDNVALEKINYFTFEIVAKDMDLPPRAAWLISVHLCNCKGGRREQEFPQYPHSFEKALKDGERGRVQYSATGFHHDVVDALSRGELAEHDLKFFSENRGGLEEIARALTLLESQIIHEAMPVSFFHHREERPHQTIVAMKNWTNALTLWVRSCIQRPSTAPERAATFGAFVVVMQHCLDLRNYSSTYTILLALKAVQSHRQFTVTAQLISSTHQKTVAQIDAFFGDPRQNFPLYRKAMATTCAPANPLFFLIGGDLVKIAAMKKQVEAQYGLEGLSKRRSWVFPQYLTRLQGIVRDLERCYALYGVPFNKKIREWVQSKVTSLLNRDYDEFIASLDSIQHADEPPVSTLQRRPTAMSH